MQNYVASTRLLILTVSNYAEITLGKTRLGKGTNKSPKIFLVIMI